MPASKPPVSSSPLLAAILLCACAHAAARRRASRRRSTSARASFSVRSAKCPAARCLSTAWRRSFVARVSLSRRNAAEGGANAGGGVGFTLARSEAKGHRFSGRWFASWSMSASTLRRSSSRAEPCFSWRWNSRTAVTGRCPRATCSRRLNATCRASKSGTSLAGVGLKLHVFCLALFEAGADDGRGPPPPPLVGWEAPGWRLLTNRRPLSPPLIG
mmetsp:Transcript_9602/g.23701  ORF Transcript_9602/g.23701 Transcript_9602/m.23701 type:complete len:216 (+) Transcript_9602:456-1103(+)